MDRRRFLEVTSGAAALTWLTPLPGCSALGGDRRGEEDFDPGPYVVVREHLVLDEEGATWVLDAERHRVIRLDDRERPAGAFAELGEETDELNHPVDAAVGTDGTLYVLDRGNGRIQAFEPDGAHRTVLAGGLFLPRDLVLHDGRLLVCDTLHHRVVAFDLEGRLVQVFGDGADGKGDGRGVLNAPSGLAFDREGRLHVLETGDASVQVFAADGAPAFRYGGFGTKRGRMLRPGSISAGGRGRMFIADATADRVHVFDEGGRFVGRFRPVDAGGAPVSPVRVDRMPDGTLSVLAGRHPSPRSVVPAT